MGLGNDGARHGAGLAALLALLWLLLTIVLKLDKEDEPEEELSPQAATVEAERIAAIADDAVGAQTPERPTVNGMPADLVAAILVATHKHRKSMRRQAAPLVRTVWPGQIFASRWLATGRCAANQQLAAKRR